MQWNVMSWSEVQGKKSLSKSGKKTTFRNQLCARLPSFSNHQFFAKEMKAQKHHHFITVTIIDSTKHYQ